MISFLTISRNTVRLILIKLWPKVFESRSSRPSRRGDQKTPPNDPTMGGRSPSALSSPLKKPSIATIASASRKTGRRLSSSFTSDGGSFWSGCSATRHGGDTFSSESRGTYLERIDSPVDIGHESSTELRPMKMPVSPEFGGGRGTRGSRAPSVVSYCEDGTIPVMIPRHALGRSSI